MSYVIGHRTSNTRYINLIEKMYQRATMQIQLPAASQQVKLERRVEKGNNFSLKLI